MKGTHQFCPTSGAALSDDAHYVENGVKLRAPLDGTVDDSWTCDGALTNGELVSGCSALIAYFRRQRRKTDVDAEIDGKAALAIRRLKSSSGAWDEWIWYATAERLARSGFDAEWMLAFAEPRCPRCSSRVKIEPSATGYPNLRCGVTCGPDSADRSIEIYDRILDTYNAAFSDTDPIERLRVFAD